MLKKLEGKYVSIVYNKDEKESTYVIELFNGVVLDPFADLAVDPENIEQEELAISKVYLLYAHAYALAQFQMSELDREMAILSAELDERYRNSVEKPTETYIKRMITSDRDYQMLQLRINNAKAIVILLKQILDAFNFKKDALFHFGTAARILMRQYAENLKRNAQEKGSEVVESFLRELTGGQKDLNIEGEENADDLF